MESSRTIPFFLLFLLFRITTLATAGADDAEILLAFKSAVANSSVVLRGWVSGRDPCSFPGVTCNSSRVSAVNLDGLPLAVDLGHVAATLMGMESLESLSLAAANVSGDLSKVAEAAACGRNLVEVDLSGNVISGSVSSISLLSTSCRGLVRLNLSGNSVSFPGGKLPSSPLLQMLDLSDNKLVGDGLLSWLLSSGNGCGGMRVLRLKNNLVSGRIPVAECSFLQHLDLSYNNFSGEMPDLGECSTLQHLDLSSNWFSGEIGSGLSSCHSLKLLNLSSNAFSGTIPSNLNGGSLQFISLAVNQLEGIIPPQLFRPCTALLELDLSENSLSGDLPDSLSGCKMLESISLSNNNFTGEIPSATLSALSHLKKLVLSFNYYSGKLSSDLFANFNQLEVFGLSSNNIEGPIPADICRGNPRLSSLKELYLQNNYFVGSIPPSLSNCSGLVSLDLSFNFLTGNIPSSLGSLSQLRDLLMWLNQLDGPIPPELSNIRNLENLILDNNGLSGSLPQELSLCSQLNWLSVSSNFLTGPIPTWLGGLSNLAILQLRNNSFTGLVPPELGNCKSLIWLDLSNNNLTGTIPGALAKQSGNIAVGLVGGKRYAYLRGDGSPGCRGAGNLIEFAGIRPEQLDRLPISHSCNLTRVYLGNTKYTFKNNGSMIFLDLSYNSLTGTIPPELGPMYYLMILNLGHNDLSGEIPPSLGQLKFIGILDLSHNHFEGQIPPSFSSMAMLAEIDVSNNNLSGPIPEQGQLATFPAFRYANNSGLCGLPLPPCGGGGASFNSASRDHQKSDKRATSLAGSIAIGLLFFVFCIVGLVIIYIENRRKRKKKRDAVDVFGDEQQSNATGWKFLPTKELLTMSISMATFDKPLQKLTLGDLLEATNNFHQDSLVGSGGFGDVYKAELKEGTVVAVKKLIHVSGQGDREFTAEMETIGKIKHRNLVPLLGYCKVGEERLLVYEYMKYGSLDDVLHDQKKGSVALDWEARRKIAVGAARGLAFLHHNCIPHIIHRDMKSSNVLLDDNLEARVSDFGMARLMSAMDTHLSVSTLAGTPGYVPPEYYQSFRCSTKGDVYSYGVVLLELLTGRQPTDSTDFGDNNLVGWVKQHAKLRISDVFDPALNVKDHPGLEMELLQHLKIACQCLDDRPWKRPTMLQVMAMFKELQSVCVSSKDSNESILPSIGSLDNVSCLKE